MPGEVIRYAFLSYKSGAWDPALRAHRPLVPSVNPEAEGGSNLLSILREVKWGNGQISICMFP